ncbi:dephospho-CoA kinase [Deferribacter desulfuricans SSM1]|uniref:Dephospho-CoA kinase n=1 Tax=Deferribacter desulfuricans (strain DSM 14783 / JCM 11476 / NBRC 101012 / SSM1) TaxID=639282 RepID=D3PB43_DEFDS|nr:dephospho-CoA kinase [Deferribacter desulfuricans]BAI79816.1 dephospho-CoA kinase [Deferribacter desulfuricans SSM1]
MSLYLGLTGNIASGKSTAAKFFEEYGCYTIDADEISRKVMKKGKDAYFKIVEAFGDNILLEDGEINRGKLKQIVFDDDRKRVILEDIVHPAIHEYEKRLVSEIKSKDDKAIIITQAALIVEKKTFDRFDGIIVVYVDYDSQLKRLLQRDNIDLNLAQKIISAQMPYEEKLKYANFIIDNSKDLSHLKNEVKRVYEVLKIYQYAKKQLKKRRVTFR